MPKTQDRTSMARNIQYLVILAIAAVTTYGWNKYTYSDKSKDEIVKEENLIIAPKNYEVPRYRTNQPPEQILNRFSYTTSYNKTTKTPNWVGWVLTADHTDGEYARKGHSFIEDSDVSLPRALYTDIRESECGYQRGHTKLRRKHF